MQAFESIKKKSAGTKLIDIINMNRLRNWTVCQVLYIDELKRNIGRQALEDLKNLPTLTIHQQKP
jgi:hypothetical protein